jgi:hypothetical protein
MAQTSRANQSAGIAKMMPVITGLVFVAYAVAAYVFLFMPKIGRLVEGGEYDLSVYETRIAEAETYANQLKELESSYRSINPDRRGRVLNMVTLGPDAPGLYVQLDALARTHDMVLVSVDAIPDEKSTSPAGRKTVRAAFNVAGGTYQQLKLFLADLERSERILDAQAVIFTPATGSYGIVARAYYFDARTALFVEAPNSNGDPGAPAEVTQ